MEATKQEQAGQAEDTPVYLSREEEEHAAMSAALGLHAFLARILGLYDLAKKAAAPGDDVQTQVRLDEVRQAAADAKLLMGWVSRSQAHTRRVEDNLGKLTDSYLKLALLRQDDVRAALEARKQVTELQRELQGERMQRRMYEAAHGVGLQELKRESEARASAEDENRNLHWLIGGMRQAVVRITDQAAELRETRSELDQAQGELELEGDDSPEPCCGCCDPDCEGLL